MGRPQKAVFPTRDAHLSFLALLWPLWLTSWAGMGLCLSPKSPTQGESLQKYVLWSCLALLLSLPAVRQGAVPGSPASEPWVLPQAEWGGSEEG